MKTRNRSILRVALPAVATAAVLTTLSSPAHATIHPIVQSINCAAAAARAHAPIADPPGQTPAAFAGEIFSVSGTILTISFPQPIALDQSDFRALQATGFIDQVVRNADGLATAVLVDLTSVAMAVSGQGGAHCANSTA